MSKALRLLYRQKVLLAFLETLKGNGDSTDVLKLMFLFCKQYKKQYYAFFPYQFGCFSFEMYKDKRTLLNKGLLVDSDNFLIDKPTGMLYQLKPEDRGQIIAFANQTKDLRGDDLIKRTYLDYPEYAKCSKIKDRILTQEEQKKLLFADSLFKEEYSIFTIGYEGIGIDEYLNKIIKNDIDTLIDVRNNPNSMKFDFNAKALKNFLSKIGVEYIGIPELGIPSAMRNNLDSIGSYNALFNKYEKEILPKCTSKIEYIVEILKKHKKIALTCFEKDYNMCHRYRIATHIERHYGYSISNL
ncbi:MAG: DUF488 family protein [Victivallales bacterium]|nr:DUF488 family protein [Victivallales bacterium]